jgi:DNA mismatch repair ATPase MutS
MRTEKSLCLIDEFGKGTAPVDGIALLATTIRYFIRNRAKVR